MTLGGRKLGDPFADALRHVCGSSADILDLELRLSPD